MYSEFYKLKSQPFTAMIDKSCFYLSSTITQSMAILQHGLINSERLLVLTGPAGVGKSSLVASLVSDLSPIVLRTWINAGHGSEVDLLSSIALNLDLPLDSRDKISLTEAVIREFQKRSASGAKQLLIIDNADALSSESLQIVMHLVDSQAMRDYGVTLLLVGRISLMKNMIKEFGSLRDQNFRMLASLKPLSESDTANYINYRLNQAGLENQKLFSVKIIKSIFALTAGIPRRINSVCDTALLCAFSRQAKALQETHLQQAIIRLGWVSSKNRVVENAMPSIPMIKKNADEASKVSVKDTMGNSVSYLLEEGILRIGRAADCEIRLNEMSISRYQAQIVTKSGKTTVSNHGSTTPIMHNGQSVMSAKVNDGDVVSVGNFALYFTILANEPKKINKKKTEKSQ